MNEPLRPKIKFSHDYFKFGNLKLPFWAELLMAVRIKRDDVHLEFDLYDTTYFDEDAQYPDCYKLPNSDLILLVFNHEEFRKGPFIFTTLRHYTPRKLAYYRGLVGETFDCVLSELTAAGTGRGEAETPRSGGGVDTGSSDILATTPRNRGVVIPCHKSSHPPQPTAISNHAGGGGRPQARSGDEKEGDE